VAVSATRQGWFSLLRWRSDVARDEAKNVALLLVDAKGAFSRFQAAPVSAVSSRLREQGLLDAALHGLERQVEGTFTLERLSAMYAQLDRSLYLTKPKAVAVHDVDTTARALYRALIAPRIGGSSRPTKSVLLDRLVTAYRRQGVSVERGAYIGDFIFDAVLNSGDQRQVVDVLSFAAPRKDWTPLERDAGHFLFGLGHVNLPGIAVVQPPTDTTASIAKETHDRVRRWFVESKVEIRSPEEIVKPQLTLDA